MSPPAPGAGPTPPVELHVEEAGAGPAVLLAHGLGGSARNFRPQQRALRDRYRVIVYDARGHARSAAPPDAAAYTLECLAGDVARVLDEAGADRAVVGGLSLGALAALHFALAHPERVLALVLASYPARDGGLARVAGSFAAAIEADGLERAGERFVWGPASGLDPAGAALVRQGFLEHAPHAIAHLLHGAVAAQPAIRALAPRLAALAVPALVVAGERDAPGVAAGRELAAALPDVRLEIVPDAGHVVNLARPAEFNDLLLAFLDARVRA